MSVRILQINLEFSVSRAEYEQAISPLDDPIAAVAGLH